MSQSVIDWHERRRLISAYTDLNPSSRNCFAVSWIVPGGVRCTMWSRVLNDGDIRCDGNSDRRAIGDWVVVTREVGFVGKQYLTSVTVAPCYDPHFRDAAQVITSLHAGTAH